MELSISREGRRSYFVGQTFAVKDALRNAGAHWDADKRAWWIGSKDEAAALVQQLAAVAPKTEEQKKAEMLESDRSNIIGTATKDGKSYYLVGEGIGSRGPWVRLMFRDGSQTFFASRSDVKITKHYQRAQSLEGLRRYAELNRRMDANEHNGGRCRESGCSATAVDRGYCRQCAFDEFDD